jgi:hypothetical protein
MDGWRDGARVEVGEPRSVPSPFDMAADRITAIAPPWRESKHARRPEVGRYLDAGFSAIEKKVEDFEITEPEEHSDRNMRRTGNFGPISSCRLHHLESKGVCVHVETPQCDGRHVAIAVLARL